jgi:hypothetical protein
MAHDVVSAPYEFLARKLAAARECVVHVCDYPSQVGAGDDHFIVGQHILFVVDRQIRAHGFSSS